jgi:hypothetical protein
MILVVNEIEDTVKQKFPNGIMGFYRTYVPNRNESYVIEPQGANYSFSTFEKLSIVPSIKIYLLSADVNNDLHADKRDFYVKCEELIKLLFENPTLNETVTQFSLDVKYSTIGKSNTSSNRKDKDYKVCEILVKVEEIL